jgi:hypothetical protein
MVGAHACLVGRRGRAPTEEPRQTLEQPSPAERTPVPRVRRLEQFFTQPFLAVVAFIRAKGRTASLKHAPERAIGMIAAIAAGMAIPIAS